MAIAIHTVKEVNHLDYNYRDYDHFKWVNYLAWKVLRLSPKYRPPSPPSTINNEHDNTSPPAEIDSVSMADSPFLLDSANTNTGNFAPNYNQPQSLSSCCCRCCFDSCNFVRRRRSGQQFVIVN
jgi:hypothetical protein